MRDTREFRAGLAFGVLAYATWGVVPLFWGLLRAVDPVEILAHRAVWGLACFAVITAALGQLGAVRTAFGDRKLILTLLGTGALLATNWGLFIWATLSGHLLQASLGYFINPLVSVALGVGFLGERLGRATQAAIGLAAIGVVWMATGAGVPWVALALALSFGLYGLVRKVVPVPALVGSTVETALMAPVAIGYLVYLERTGVRGGGVFGHGSLREHLLLVAGGAITAVPLVWFTSAARRLPLSVVGLLQYLAPTGQLLTALLVFGEELAQKKLIAFGFIWAALAVFSIDLVRRTRGSPGRA